MGLIPPLFSGPVASLATQFIGVPIIRGCVGVQIAWPDATTAGAMTLEVTNAGAVEAPVETAGTLDLWKDSGATITITAGARNSTFVNLMNVRQRRARLKFVASAASVLTVLQGIDQA